MTREPRRQASPEPGASPTGGRDGLPGADLGAADLGAADLRAADLGAADLGAADLRAADLRVDAVAVKALPYSALGDGDHPSAGSGDALGPQTAAATTERPTLPSRGTGVRPRRPSLGGGIPAQGRELGAQGRQTVRRLLEAGLAEFDERGFQAVRVDDVVRRAKTSHGTFYLYFANKDDLFRTLLRDALRDMETITDDFPVVTSNDGGRAALRRWIQSFTDTYAAHATVIRILSQAEIVGEQVYGDGLRLLFRLSEAIAQGMTVASAGHRTDQPAKDPAQHAELTALACLMMLERINYLLSVDVRLPREEMVDRLSAIIYAAFHTP